MHLAIDGFGAGPERLADADLVRTFLDRYPDRLGMRKMIPPQVYTYRGKVPEDWGLSGFVLIAESHISVHTFPERDYMNIDVFSCKDFDTDAARLDVEKTFGLARSKSWTMERGIEHASPRDAYEGMVSERVHLSYSGSSSDG